MKKSDEGVVELKELTAKEFVADITTPFETHARCTSVWK